MSTQLKFLNNVTGTLSVALGNDAGLDTSVVLTTGHGARFSPASPSVSTPCVATLVDNAGNFEVVHITAVSTDTLTVIRAREGTSAITFAEDTSTISLRVTKGLLEALSQKAADETISGAWTFTTNPVFVGAGGVLGSFQVFTTGNDGPGAWSKPAGLRFAIVEGVGAGGAGGGSGNTGAGEQSNGGGGGGGGYFLKKIAAGSLGATEDVTVGAGGTGVSASTGNSGGTSSFGAHASATGGSGGTTAGVTTSPNTANGGAGGAGSNGDVNLTGQGGGFGSGQFSGGGTARSAGGAGGSSRMGGGAQGNGNGSSGAAGIASGNYGGGGSGACSSESGGTNRSGGAGADGLIIVWEFY